MKKDNIEKNTETDIVEEKSEQTVAQKKKKTPIRVSIPIVIIITAIVAVMTFQVTFLKVSQSFRNQEIEKYKADKVEDWERKISSLDELTKQYYLYDVSAEVNKTINDVLPKELINSLGDEYTYYLSADEYNKLYSNTGEKKAGIGISVLYNGEHQAIEIVSVNKNSPAFESGVLSGDLIYSVEGQNVSEIGYDKALEIMAGKEGEKVNFSVKRNAEEGFSDYSFSIERKVINAEYVTYNILHGNIGLIRFDSFGSGADKQFDTVVKELVGQGADKFVFDLRNTSSGSIDVLAEILDIILPEGKTVRLVDKNGKENSSESDKECLDYPMVVVVNGRTSALGEIFAITLKDYEKALLVGEKTYGKGSAQSIFRLSDGSAVCMTTQLYMPPKSQSFDRVGIEPDIQTSIEEQYKDMNLYQLTLEQDAQLKTAVEQLSK